MRYRLMALLVLLTLVASEAAWADRAETLHGLYEQGKSSTVIVTFYVETERGKAKRTIAGTVVSNDGLIVVDGGYFPTNLPLESFVEFDIRFEGENVKPAGGHYLGKDEDAGVAFVQAEPREGQTIQWKPVVFDTEKPVRPGDDLVSVTILPEELGYAKALSVGMALAVIEKPELSVLYGELFTGAHNAFFPTLGVPVFTLDGRAVGLMGRKNVGRATTVNIGGRPMHRAAPQAFAMVPASRFKALVANPPRGVVAARRPWLGIGGLTRVNENVAEFLGLPKDAKGLVIGQIIDGGPGGAAGLKVEDVLLKIDGEVLDMEEQAIMESFRDLIRQFEIGQTVELTLWRDRQEITVPVTMSAAPIEAGEAQRWFVREFGFTGRDLVMGDRLGARLPQDESGLIVSYLEQGGPAANAGMQGNDIVKRIAGQDITDIASLKAAIEQARNDNAKEVVVLVLRGGRDTTILRIEPDWTKAAD